LVLLQGNTIAIS